MSSCSGCKTCMVSCMDKNDLPIGVKWRRVTEFTGGEWMQRPDGTFGQNVFAYYVSMSCNHCDDPICVKVCPTTAMHRNEHNIVTVDHNKCVGCRYCEMNCPYSAPQFNAELGKMTKCDFCYDKQLKGETPTCVAACPMRAIKFGEFEELKKMYGESQYIAPLPNPALTKPRLTMIPSRNAKPGGSTEGMQSNPEEV
ncbi:MAG: dimethylsulfoxide reductase subunit B [Desulfovibrio sp.]|nr:dimethylsulfoxide reductase subunit B [Desulfovibrio sp.]